MRLFRAAAVLLALPFFAGCGYVHFGRLPSPALGDAASSQAYTNLATEHKILKQELELARKEGDALRAVIDRSGSTTSPELVARLNETTRELATLRASYAKLQAARGPADPATGARAAELEEKLAVSLRNYTQLQEENARLRTDLAGVRAENTALSEQLKTSVAQNEQAQGALAQLNAELLAQKDARARADQAAAAVRAQLSAVLAAGRTETPVTAPAAPPAVALDLPKPSPDGPPPTAELRTDTERLQRANAANSATPPPQTAGARRTHIVEAGETLEKIAQKYYGDPQKWLRVYSANETLLRDGQAMRAGMELTIPEN